MLISILVPVFNWDISRLIASLLAEIDTPALEGLVELIVVDDASTDAALLSKNNAFLASNSRPCLRYLPARENLGRARVRNTLAAEASGRFLLFLDCDVLPDSGDFIGKYLFCAEADSHDVVCGGISYRTRVMLGTEFDYHAYLGNRKEVKSAADRNKEPWRHILTSNIMVRKSVFECTSFDERFTGYGYEDIEWGVRLSREYRILHIDNTASHLGLVSKITTYDKMRASVRNYLLLKELCPGAFHASTISKLVSLLTGLSESLLEKIDVILKSMFLSQSRNDVAFLLYQFNFAVLLALGTKRAARR
ncbi:glycosyltransferase [Geomonas sp. Red69]|uniref:Glycosyltransferase n=1 Tax=Geomonas diazotrophica TaxID=2843197 RepID=A0ABX8JJL3_9BACT|nr:MULTISPECIES: glycosyltransferase family 2 protein [Geomonas]MBU5636003.1 glycosyltransferase [Geomonas diazotrophica]QWV96819.1 glycosyltransferase [Geomonas nitrogeniifigens]QXE85919.1 glycosyltransferase [Geomonas nitrogeniifigens]